MTYCFTKKTHWFIEQKDPSFANDGMSAAKKVEFVRETAKAVLVRWSDIAGYKSADITEEMWIPKSCLSTSPEVVEKREERKQYQTSYKTAKPVTKKRPSDTEVLIATMGKMAAATIDTNTEYGKQMVANARAEYECTHIDY